jgi:hypothetical protein
MDYDCGIDVSLEQSSVCVVGATGSIMREATVASDPDGLPILQQYTVHIRRHI